MSDAPTLWTYRARLDRVVDGDTVYLTVDLGMRVLTTVSIRLSGVDTPEINRGDDAEREAGRAARDQVAAWLSEAADLADDPDWPLIVETDRDRRSFNRYLGWITTARGRSLNEYLIGLGYGSDR